MSFGNAFGHLLHKSLPYQKFLHQKRTPFSLLTDRKAATTTHSSSAVKLVKAIRVHQFGGPEVLKYEDIEVGEPKDGEIRVKNKAIGLSFIDVQNRKGEGEFKVSKIPFIRGIEAAGMITAVGPKVLRREVGDYVAYAGSPMGAYAEEQILPADEVVPVPPSMDPTVAASIMFKGMSAHYLLRHYYKVDIGDRVLIHGATSGIGSLMCQWANALGAMVIGTVSTKEKAAQAYDDGCRHVIVTDEDDFIERVKEVSSPYGVYIVYDFVGEDTFEGCLSCLVPWGNMVIIGQSGLPDPVPLAAAAAKSVYLTKPSLMHYPATVDELRVAAEEVFKNVELGNLKVRVNRTYHLSMAAQALADVKDRKISDSVLLIP